MSESELEEMKRYTWSLEARIAHLEERLSQLECAVKKLLPKGE